MDGHEYQLSASFGAVRWLRRSPLLAMVIPYGALYLSWMILRWGPPTDRRVIGDLFQILLNVVVAWLCWRAAHRCESAPALRSVWRLIAAGATAAALGNVAQLYYEGVLGRLPHPSLAEAFILVGYLLVIAALLRFPTARASGAQRLQLTLDAGVLAVGGAVVMWYVELGPAVMQGSTHPLAEELMSGLFTIGDLIVLAAVAGVLTRGTMPSSTRALRLFAGGCLVLVSVDVLYGYVTVRLHQTYAGGDWLDAVWFMGLVLWALAAGAQREPAPGELAQLRTTVPVRRRPSWMPYVAVATGLGLMIYAERDDAFFPGLSLALASVVLVVLVSVRQYWAQRELIDVQRELQRAHDELAALATTDALTGLPNHRGLIAAIDHELERSHRNGRRLALAFLDLDHFKAVNDTLGHAAGDRALRETGEIIKTSLRAIDTVGRWGGEEFVLLLPESDADAALIVAERIRAAIAQHRYGSADDAHLTCSIGVCIRPDDGTDRNMLLAAADKAMYAAKRLGRNQVIAAGDQASSTLGADTTSSSREEEEAMLGAVEALAAVLDARDSCNLQHSTGVANLSRRVALMTGCDAHQTHLIGLAARLHDIGKVAIPDAILGKQGPLSTDEWRLIEQHPAIGAEIVGRIPRLRAVTPLIRAHHERYDGTGYPDRIVGDAIPLGARIISAADAYDAMITDRPYGGAGRSPAEALQELRRCAGTQFDPRVVRAFTRLLVAHDQVALQAA